MKRIEAISLGLVTYSSGKPCRRGHTAQRYASNGMCVECVAHQATEIRDARKVRAAGLILVTLATHPDDEQALRAFAQLNLIARGK